MARDSKMSAAAGLAKTLSAEEPHSVTRLERLLSEARQELLRSVRPRWTGLGWNGRSPDAGVAPAKRIEDLVHRFGSAARAPVAAPVTPPSLLLGPPVRVWMSREGGEGGLTAARRGSRMRLP